MPLDAPADAAADPAAAPPADRPALDERVLRVVMLAGVMLGLAVAATVVMLILRQRRLEAQARPAAPSADTKVI